MGFVDNLASKKANFSKKKKTSGEKTTKKGGFWVLFWVYGFSKNNFQIFEK